MADNCLLPSDQNKASLPLVVTISLLLCFCPFGQNIIYGFLGPWKSSWYKRQIIWYVRLHHTCRTGPYDSTMSITCLDLAEPFAVWSSIVFREITSHRPWRPQATAPAGYFDSMIVSMSAFQRYCNETFFLNTKGICRPILIGSNPTRNTFAEKTVQMKCTKFFVKSYRKDEPHIQCMQIYS